MNTTGTADHKTLLTQDTPAHNLRRFLVTVTVFEGRVLPSASTIAEKRISYHQSIRDADDHKERAGVLWCAGVYPAAAEMAITADNLRASTLRCLELLAGVEQTKQDNRHRADYKEYVFDMLLPTLHIYSDGVAEMVSKTPAGTTLSFLGLAKVLLPKCVDTDLSALPAVVVNEMENVLEVRLRLIATDSLPMHLQNAVSPLVQKPIADAKDN